MLGDMVAQDLRANRRRLRPQERDRRERRFGNGEETAGELNPPNDGTFDDTKKDRKGALDTAFSKMPAAEQQAASAVSQLFDHGRSGQFTAHSAELIGKAKLASSEPSLADRVHSLTGRR